MTDLSPEMLIQSHKINPECENIQGDMRSLRLKQRFVFVHDAIMNITSKRDLACAMKTAFIRWRRARHPSTSCISSR